MALLVGKDGVSQGVVVVEGVAAICRDAEFVAQDGDGFVIHAGTQGDFRQRCTIAAAVRRGKDGVADNGVITLFQRLITRVAVVDGAYGSFDVTGDDTLRQHIAQRFIADAFGIPFGMCFTRVDQAVSKVAGEGEVGIGEQQFQRNDIIVLRAGLQVVNQRTVVAGRRQGILRRIGNQPFQPVHPFQQVIFLRPYRRILLVFIKKAQTLRVFQRITLSVIRDFRRIQYQCFNQLDTAAVKRAHRFADDGLMRLRHGFLRCGAVSNHF